MSLADRLEAATTYEPKQCLAARRLEEARAVEPDAVADLEQAMADRRLTRREVAEILTSEGFPVERTTVQDHAAGRCCCT